jgi:hypothetical protein
MQLFVKYCAPFFSGKGAGLVAAIAQRLKKK